MTYPEVQFNTNATGFSLLSSSYSPSSGFQFVSLVPWGDRKATAAEIVQRLNRDLAVKVKGAQAFAFGPPAIPGLGNGSGFSIMLQDKGGNNTDYLAINTMKFIQAANARPHY